MARGWESKSVEEQQSVAQQPTEGKRPIADREHATQRRSLELQISQLNQQLQAARHERHREMLEKALGELRSRISNL
jgi:hypothetical protein